MSKITLQCVKEHNKLRIKFFSYTDSEGKVFTNVYNNELNCKFPKDIRQEGYYYEINHDDLTLVTGNAKPFYNVKTKNIKIIPNYDITNLKIYEINECVICLDEATTEIVVPCGHKCLCKNCSVQLVKTTKNCPICRKTIGTIIS